MAKPKIPPAPKPVSGQDFWKANPKLAYQALQYLQSHATDQGIGQQIQHAPQFGSMVKGPNAPHIAQQLVHTQLDALQKKGVDPQTAHFQLYSELLNAHAHSNKKISASEQITDPIEELYKEGGDPTAEAIVKLGGTIQDPFQLLKKKANPQEAQAALFAATFARSPLGQKALAENNPQSAAKLARVQMEQQIVTQFSQIAGDGGLADAYDAYLQDKKFRQTATASQKRAAGPALPDPLTALGYTRSSFHIPQGQELNGSTIRAAAIADMDKERGSLRQIGKPGSPGFATGVPIPGTQVDKFIKSLEKAGVVGKKLAQAMTSGGLSGQDAFVAYQELLANGSMDQQLQAQMAQARAATKLPTAGAGATTGGGTGPIQAK